MTLTRDFQHSIQERYKKDKKFAKALLDEARELISKGDLGTAAMILKDLVHG